MIVTHRVHLQPIGNFFSWPYTKSRHTFLAIVSVGTSCMSVPHVMYEMQSMQVYYSQDQHGWEHLIPLSTGDSLFAVVTIKRKNVFQEGRSMNIFKEDMAKNRKKLSIYQCLLIHCTAKWISNLWLGGRNICICEQSLWLHCTFLQQLFTHAF